MVDDSRSLTDDPLHSQNDLVSFGAILRAELVIRIRIQQVPTQVPNSPWADRADSFWRIWQGNPVNLWIRHLFQVVPIGPDPNAMRKSVTCRFIEMNCLSRLRRSSGSCERRCVVRSIPEVMNSPARLEPLGRK